MVGQHRAVSPRSTERQLRALGQRRQRPLLGEDIGAFADRPGEVLRHQSGVGLHQRQHVMIGVVERRTHQVVHPRVEQQEAVIVAVLGVDHVGDHHPRVAYQKAPRLHDRRQAQRPEVLHRRGSEVGRVGAFTILGAVGDAQPAAHIQPLEHGALLAGQMLGQVRQPPVGVGKGLDLQQLAADVHGQRLQPHVGQGLHLAHQRRNIVEGQAEFVASGAGGDLGQRLRVDIRVDPQGDGRGLAQPPGGGIEGFQLGPALDVELQDPGSQPGFQLGRLLGDPGKNDLLWRYAPGQRALELTGGDDIGADAVAGDVGDDVGVHVGLDGVADQRVERGEGGLQALDLRADMGAGVDIQRRAVLRGQWRQRHARQLQRTVRAVAQRAEGTGHRRTGRRRGFRGSSRHQLSVISVRGKGFSNSVGGETVAAVAAASVVTGRGSPLRPQAVSTAQESRAVASSSPRRVRVTAATARLRWLREPGRARCRRRTAGTPPRLPRSARRIRRR